jgi:hypothetical protein
VGATASTSYAKAGAYTVTLKVTDDKGSSQTTFRSVEVTDPPPQTPPPGDGGTPQGEPAPEGGSQGVAGTQLRPGWLVPFPVVRIAGRTTKRGARFKLFSIAAPAGSKVQLRCAGKGCPWKVRNAVVDKRKRLRVRSLERSLRAGTVISVRVTKDGLIGKYTRFRIRAIRPPTRYEACALPGASKPAQCPAS